MDKNYRSDPTIIHASKALLQGRFSINNSSTSSSSSPSTLPPVLSKLPTALSIEETRGLSQLSDDTDDMRQYDYHDDAETSPLPTTSTSTTTTTTNNNNNNHHIIAAGSVGVILPTANKVPALTSTTEKQPTGIEPAVQIVSAFHDKHQAEYIAHMIDYLLSAGLVKPSEVCDYVTNMSWCYHRNTNMSLCCYRRTNMRVYIDELTCIVMH